MSKLKTFYYGLFLSFLMLANVLASPNNFTANIGKLKVGVILAMPFAQDIEEHYSGIAIDLWENIASINRWDYVYVPLTINTESELKRLTKDGDLDVVIGPVSVSSKRLQSVDFTRPYFLSSIGVITQKHELNLFDVLRMFFSKTLVLSIVVLLLSFIIFIHLLWYVERGKLDGVSTNYYPAISKGIWQHLFKKGLGLPSTTLGRVITLVWIIFAALLVTSINANYTAAMTVSLGQSNSKITSVEDLRSVKVAGVNGQLNSEVTEQNGIYVQKVGTLDEAINLLINSNVDAVVCDAPVGIEYLRLHGTKKYIMSPLVIQNDEIAFALRLNSPIRHQIDLGLTKLQDSGAALAICRRYIGEQATRCDM